jgi:hypothetical protein
VSILRKLGTYCEGWRGDRHAEPFGTKQMRLLFGENCHLPSLVAKARAD